MADLAIPSNRPLVIVDDVREPRRHDILATGIFSPTELDRVGKLLRQLNRAEFLGAREIVRTTLGQHLGRDASDVPIIGAPNQKPRVAGETGRQLDFSISHADGRIACAFIVAGRIGVDLEARDRKIDDLECLARRVLSRAEWRAVTRSSDALATFLHVWTRKEAIVKAMGDGLAFPLSTFDVIRSARRGVEDLSNVTAGTRVWTCASLECGLDAELAVAYALDQERHVDP
jgi:4'-phosphopantetheinyl transferase